MQEKFIKIIKYCAIPLLLTALLIAIFGFYKVRNRKVKKNAKELKHRKRKYKENSFKRLTNQDTNYTSVEVYPKMKMNPFTMISLDEYSSNEDISDNENFSNLHVVSSKRSLPFAKSVKENDVQYVDSNNSAHTKSCIRNRCIENFTQTEALEKDASVQVEIVPKNFYDAPLSSTLDSPQTEECPHYCQVCKTGKSFVCNRSQTSPTFQGNCDRESEEKDFGLSHWLRDYKQFSTTESQPKIRDDCILNVSPLRSRSFEEWPLTRMNGDYGVARVNDYSNEFYKDDVGKFKYAHTTDRDFPSKINPEQITESRDYQDYRFAEAKTDLYSEILGHTWQKKSSERDQHLKKLNDRWLRERDERLAELASNLKNSQQKRHYKKWRRECGNRDLPQRKIEDKWQNGTKERGLRIGIVDNEWPKPMEERHLYRERPEDKYQEEYSERRFFQEKFDDNWQNEFRDRDLHRGTFYRKRPKAIRERSLYRGKIDDKLQKESSESDSHREQFHEKRKKQARKRDLYYEIKKPREIDLYSKWLKDKWQEDSSEKDLYTWQYEDEWQEESNDSDLYRSKFAKECQEESNKTRSYRKKFRDKRKNKIPNRNLYRINHENKMCIESKLRESPYKITDSEAFRLSQEPKNYKVSELKKNMRRGMCEYKRQNEIRKIVSLSRSSDRETIIQSSEGESYSTAELRNELHYRTKYENGRSDESKDKRIPKKANSKQFMEGKECKKCRISKIRQNLPNGSFENQVKSTQLKYKSPPKKVDEFVELRNKKFLQYLDLERTDNQSVNHEEKSSNFIHRDKIALCEKEFDQFVKEVDSKDFVSSRLKKELGKNRLKEEISEDSNSEVGSSEVSNYDKFMDAGKNKNVSQFKRERHVEEFVNGNWKSSHCSPLNIKYREQSEAVKAKNLMVSKRKQDHRFAANDDLDGKENANIVKKLLQNQMSPVKEGNHITKLKHAPERKLPTNYLKGQYHNLDDEIPQKTQIMVQELKKVLEKRGVSN